MGTLRKFLFTLILSSVFISCEVGLGQEVDLIAPELKVERIICKIQGQDDSVVSISAATIHTRKNVIFEGLATDNSAVTKVTAEISWNSQNYTYLGEAELNGENWTFPVMLNGEGACTIRFKAFDFRENAGSKSSKVVNLFVDETAPVGYSWYIDRNLGGIRYDLQSKEYLESILQNDPNLVDPSNIDVAQNGNFFYLCATFKDASEIESTSINIYEDKNGVESLVCGPIEKESDSDKYLPKFKISRNNLAASGRHFYKIKYSSEDTVTSPAPNKAENVEPELGYFIWWPESDNPKVNISGLNNKNGIETLDLYVKSSFNLTVIDDDGILGDITYTMKGSDIDVSKSVSANKMRTNSINIEAPEKPQTFKLTVSAKDIYSKSISKEITVNVASDDIPNLIITSPENNQVPNVTGNDANISFSGISLDLLGCDYLDVLWVPNSKGNDAQKEKLANEFLDQVKNNRASYNVAKDYDGSGNYSGLKLKVIKLESSTQESNLYRQSFDFQIPLLTWFTSEEVAQDKNFYIRLYRKNSGTNCGTQILKLAGDNIKPEIETIVPSGNMAIVDASKPLTIRFKGVKSNGLPMDPSKYKIWYIPYPDGDLVELPGSVEGDVFKISSPISVDDLSSFVTNRINPKYKLRVVDLLGNENEAIYQFVVSTLPEIRTVTSSAPSKCKAGDSILINVTFSKAVACPSSAKLKLTNVKNTKLSQNASDTIYANYKSGNNSTTLVFEYIVKEGDTSTGLQVYNETEVGPILGLDLDNVRSDRLKTEDNLQAKRASNPITLDGTLPKVTDISITTDAETENKKDGIDYLKNGRKVTAKITVDKKVSIQGSPKFEFYKDSSILLLNWESIDQTGKIITFSKTIQDSDVNGEYTYYPETCITDKQVIKDDFGNSIVLSTGSSKKLISIDTVKPVMPLISGSLSVNNDANGQLKSDKYRDSVNFVISGTANEKTQYSLDGGSTWIDYTSEVSVTANATIVARRIDFAGNISDYTSPINVEVNSSFPDFTLECTNADGNYKNNTKLVFKVYFESPVNIASNSNAYIALSKNSSEEKITDGAKAVISASSKGKTNVSEATFEYVTKSTDEFTLKVEKAGVVLNGINDLYGITQGSKTLDKAYERSKLRCDSIAPTISITTPSGTKKTLSNGKTSYTNAKQIVLTFSEPVKAVSGKIYLRQTEGWAIPPMFNGKEFSIILNALKTVTIDKTKTNNLTGSQVLYLDGLEDSEWLFSSQPGRANDRYHGTGQYAGPYKKSTQGVDSSGNPDISTKYVLDYDVDIWDSNNSRKTKFGTTFEAGNSSQTNNSSTTNNVRRVTPTNTITTDNIRYVLEQVHFHERYMNVNSSYVIINGNTVTLNFPSGLLGESDLPLGREWELVIEKGAFMDNTGNYFGAEEDGSINKQTEAFVNIPVDNNKTFFSGGVAKPVIRVDRYSYGLGMDQPSQTGTLSMIGGNNPVPTAYVRVRVDCETKGAVVRYNTKKNINSVTTNAAPANGDEYIDNDMQKTDQCISYYSGTTATMPEVPSSTNKAGQNAQSIEFICGTGTYNQSCKEMIYANAEFNGITSDTDKEGVFQTVLHLVSPIRSDGTLIANNRDGGARDFSVRGTTGFAGEPYIAPFPLRDSQVGSPYLKRAYRNGNDYYWVSYEILVYASVSAYMSDNSKYDWAKTWGVIYPGEYTRCIRMRRW